MQLLNSLNEQQKRAVTSDSSHVLLLAGAGSGKTKTLTSRVAYLNQNRIGIVNMLCLTFTRLAGQEMKERVIKLIGDDGKNLFCNTFHAFCVKLIRDWGSAVGIEKNFTIYDQEDQEAIVLSIIDDLGYSKKVKPKNVIPFIYEINGIPFEVGNVIQEYRYRLTQNNAIDLDGLLYSALDTLRASDRARDDYHNRFKYIFVDEFQDTNDIQMEIIKLISPENLFVVGDDFQSIYGWRGANVNLILEFPEMYSGCEVIKLEQNYRSTSSIVEAANNLISHNINQTKKKLYTDKNGCSISVFTYDDEEIEAENIKALILGDMILNHDLENYSNFAVLARTNRQLETIKSNLDKDGIPTQLVYSRDDVFKKNDIKVLTAAIQLAINHEDNYSLRKLLKFPKPRITQIELEECELTALEKELPLISVLKGLKRPSIKVTLMLNFIDILNAQIMDGLDALETFKLAYEVTDTKEYYEKNHLTNRIEDYEKAVFYIYRWMQRQNELGESTSPQALIRWLRLKDMQEKLAEEKNAVKLMTIHAAKGLEFPTVFIVGMNQGTFPSKRSENLEEERRLFYVAITRAKECLYLTRPIKTVVWGNETTDRKVSQFIGEISEVKNGR